ncbi:MAG: GGDEF domain-containing protein [Candidatus Dormiibacterota bacterium]
MRTRTEPDPSRLGPTSDLVGTPGGLRSHPLDEPRHTDRPPRSEEVKAILAASLGIDASELRGVSADGAVTALARLNELVRRLADRAATDDLTGALRRGAGYSAARADIERARRTGLPLTLVVVDVDGLKRINDHSGHLFGDRVLRRVAGELAAAMRGYDVLIRFGGDEFLCVLGGAAKPQARRRMAGIQARLSSAGISISFGLAELREADALDDLISRADAALYAGRTRMRNRPPGGPRLGEGGEASRPGG